MSAVRYPIAANPDAALHKPIGRAARESEAQAAAGVSVEFVTEPAGPAFPTREAALDAYAGRIDEDRPGRPSVAPEDRFCELREVMVKVRGRMPRTGQAKPVFAGGRRWPEPPAPPATVWRLSVSYWRTVDAARHAELEQARKARKREGAELDREALRALARQPLQPVKPQQPLDVGLFEFRPPEAPHILMPDE